MTTEPSAMPFRMPAPDALRRPWHRTLWGLILKVCGLGGMVSLVLGYSGEPTLAAFGNTLLLLALLVALVTFLLGTLIEALRAPDWLWAEASQNKVTFVLLIVVLLLLGAILYTAIARPALRAALERSA